MSSPRMLRRLAMLGLVSALGCAGLFGRTRQAQLDPATGRPIFDGHDFRHPGGTPFWCYAFVNGKGEHETECLEIQEWCAGELRKTHEKGGTVLGACKQVEQVSCLTFYRGDATKTFCYETPENCERTSAFMMSPDFGASPAQLTPCKTLDESFQPAS